MCDKLPQSVYRKCPEHLEQQACMHMVGLNLMHCWSQAYVARLMYNALQI